MQKSLFPFKDWWQNKNAPDRFMLMNKYSVKTINDKELKKMYNKEFKQ